MEKAELNSRISAIAQAVAGMTYCDWRKIADAVEHKFSTARARVELTDAVELENAIKTIPLWPD